MIGSIYVYNAMRVADIYLKAILYGIEDIFSIVSQKKDITGCPLLVFKACICSTVGQQFEKVCKCRVEVKARHADTKK